MHQSRTPFEPAVNPRLKTLVWSGNALSGTLPESMDQLASLEQMLVHANEFSGTISDGWVLCSVLPLTCSALQHVLSVVVQSFIGPEPPHRHIAS